MIRNFFRHIWESIKNLKRNIWMTIAAVSSVAITLTLVGIFAATLLNIDRVASGVQNNIRINTYLPVDSTDTAKVVQTVEGKQVDNEKYHKIYDNIKKIKGVDKIIFSSKDEQLKKLQDTMGDVWKMYDQDTNPLQDIYIVETEEPSQVKQVSKAIKSLDGVEDVDYGGINSDKLFKFSSFIKTWGLAGTGLLLLVAVFLISNTIRMTIMSRQRDIEIMRLVGAKNSYIRGPFFFEGAWVGFLGAIIPSLIIYYLYEYAYRQFTPQLQLNGLSMYPVNYYLYILIAVLFIIGIIIGSLGSVLSMRRYLKF
ncbi:permease-like cell division protein FtsX [Streptococcus uberis]|uniref:permease-like cell division protein FtsX n=1 Tax=Streptococcus uberis TaxID=1349 RepID=UPI000541E9D6|nr:permease-like cell division protein FtsX [Streptococcus uberis]KHD41264.1 cell division protein FtsX [Streptococcus hongkongensis]MCK1164933.1 permease-like cell division protein FtsX [Streptococcus uberis]MCK1190466.1 permease-like cell division protein FtsX [Streptococcus uberis]MCK1193987.1 permease-like cell division protein FtsX [Streptococcus uberis]MCK1199881.1 permease-like cell division protein FtsX [Streptococcus uberis]